MYLEIIIATAASVSFCFIIFRANKKKLEEEKNNFIEQINIYKENHEILQKSFNSINEEKISLIKKVTQLETEKYFLNQEVEKLKTENINETESKKESFKNIAQEILDEKSKKFVYQNKLEIDSILRPLSEKILKFEETVSNTNKEHIERTASLKSEVKKLAEVSCQANEEANKLSRALKGDNKLQGNWGEFILESILEKSGLVRDREFFVQKSCKNEDGNLLRPDVIIKLPENKNIIIDSKVSLINYEKLVNTENKITQQEEAKKHVDSIRSHIFGLSAKDYPRIYEINSLDFVLLFIPIEPAFSIALNYNNKLFLEAYEKNIILVSPTTLLATLRTISNVWQVDYRINNQQKIAQQVGSMYDKFVAFVEDLQKLGGKLKMASNAYEDSMTKLVTGQGNLIRRAEQIKKYGIQPKKDLPIEIVNKSDSLN